MKEKALRIKWKNNKIGFNTWQSSKNTVPPHSYQIIFKTQYGLRENAMSEWVNMILYTLPAAVGLSLLKPIGLSSGLFKSL